jgi:hypothetical protein
MRIPKTSPLPLDYAYSKDIALPLDYGHSKDIAPWIDLEELAYLSYVTDT